MQAIEIARAFLASLENLDETGFKAITTPDFQMTGPTPVPFNQEQAFGLALSLIGAMPDWKFNLEQTGEDGKVLRGVLHVTATHTRELHLPFLNLPPIAPTGIKIVQPAEATEFVIEGDKVAVWQVESGAEGGVPGVLRQLGVPLRAVA